jgi:hypothetical protein
MLKEYLSLVQNERESWLGKNQKEGGGERKKWQVQDKIFRE